MTIHYSFYNRSYDIHKIQGRINFVNFRELRFDEIARTHRGIIFYFIPQLGMDIVIGVPSFLPSRLPNQLSSITHICTNLVYTIVLRTMVYFDPNSIRDFRLQSKEIVIMNMGMGEPITHPLLFLHHLTANSHCTTHFQNSILRQKVQVIE